ncbi:MAG TPA: alkyl hydroperoxide reductase, partial [Gemmatimonadaceae bacterium]|nr:alkyl hydroperoxide reductase [Gemmatimonadaceae bacterium]
MRELERRFPAELAVVGVHSGKYAAERVTARIREASLRLGVEHAVVNDRQFRVWRAYAVRAWPTLVVLDARGYAVGQHAGELTADQLAPFLERLIAAGERDGSLTRAPAALRYPGKVALDATRRRIAVADTGHHRVLVGALDEGG